MEYKKYDCNSYNIHTIKTDKFKTVRMEIIFSREVKKEEMPIFTFLADILTDSSKEFKRRKDIAIRLEELYKAVFYGVTKEHSIISDLISPTGENGYNIGTRVRILWFEVYNDVEFVPREVNK